MTIVRLNILIGLIIIPGLLSAADTPKEDDPKTQALKAQVVEWLVDPESHYQLRDQGRDGEVIGVLKTSKTIAVGDLLYIDDSIWEVTKVQITTELRDSKLSDAKVKFYRVKGVSLAVKFFGKSKRN